MLNQPLINILACPQCGSAELNIKKQYCTACGQHFFDLSGLPCWFDTGLAQRALWESLYALTMRNAQNNMANEAQRDLSALHPKTRERLEATAHINQAIVRSVDSLLGDIGLKQKVHKPFENYDPSRMLQYFELLLRDWAWDGAQLVSEKARGNDNGNIGENQRELERVKSALEATGKPLGTTWIIGCGAGRLSLDIHLQLKPELTIAMDTNPVLISAAHRLVVQQKPWQLAEQHANPQAGLPRAKIWDIQPPEVDAKAIGNWHLMAGNAWRPALQPNAFDTIITPWFIDVNGKDIRTLIGHIQKYLKPGGLWLNTGPLLYNPDIAEEYRYSHEEIVALAELAGFEFRYQNAVTTEYLVTPLAAEKRIDQVWTFAAINHGMALENYPSMAPPAWVVLPHLVIPAGISFNTQSNPVLEKLASLVDGQRSINDIAEVMRPNLGEGKDPVALVIQAFTHYLLVK